MPEFTRSFPELQGPLTLRVDTLNRATADVPVSVVTDPGVSSPQLTVRGSREDLDQISPDLRAGHLGVSLPGRSGGGINISGGSFRGISIGNSVSMENVTIAGVDVTNYVRSQQPGGAAGREPMSVEARVPPGSSVEVDLNGSPVTLAGQFRAIDVQNHAGDVRVQGEFGNGRVKSHSGNIMVDSVIGDADLRTHSGNIHVAHADPSGHLDMQSHSGNVTYRVGSLEALNKIQGQSFSGRVTHGTSSRAAGPRAQGRQDERGGERSTPHRGRFDGRSW